MVIRYSFTTLVLGLCISSIWGQKTAHLPIDINQISNIDNNPSLLIDQAIDHANAHIFEIPLTQVITDLIDAPDYKTQKEVSGTELDLSLPNGNSITVQIHEAPVSHLDHYNKYPNNKTYKITSGDDSFISGRLAISPRGVRGLLYTENQTVFIESLEGDQHISYIYTKSKNIACDADMREYVHEETSSTRSNAAFGDELIEYNIAIASSGEWSNERNDDLTIINDDINTYLAELNAIYENELASTFTLIADNDDIIFFDPATDGLDENNRTVTAHNVISGAIPAGDYDIGHVFHEMDYTGPAGGAIGSGVAGLGVTCKNSRKAEGWTGAGGSYNTATFMNIFAHEVGHQFNATHSFYGTSANCQGGNRSTGSGYEPGSGNSLMSYESICWQNGSCTESHNITPVSNTVYFHTKSVEQINDYINVWGCVTPSSSGNTPPVVTVPANKHIPKSTPFEMSGSATDANGDALVYHWEECDTDVLILNCPDGNPNDAATSTTAPLFRSFDPTSDGNYRSFPQTSDLINNVQTKGEILPSVGRDIKLRLVARDFNSNAGGVDCGDVTLTVDGNSGPFEVTIANDPDPAYQSGETVTVTWNVNNTASSPINCTNVEIEFSLDGGMTYPISLASSTSNDGSHDVIIPSNSTSQGRIKIKAIGNYFFDINDEDITIISDCSVDGGDIINTDLVTADAGDPALDLMLQSGLEITQMTGSLASSDPASNLNCENLNTNGCVSFTNIPKFGILTFTVDISGDYTFTRSSSYFSVLNIYEESYDNGNVCTNWIASSATYNPNTGAVSLGFSVTENLTAGNTYVLKFSGFSSSNTGSYTVSFSNSIGGKVYDLDGTSPPGYTSSYIVVEDNSNNIIGIDTSPDMTDDNIYTGGDYTVHGLSYISSNDLSSYINGPFATLQSAVLNGTECGDFTSNTKSVTINGCTPGTKTVTSSANSGAGTLRTLMTDACPGDLIVFSSSIPDNTTITLITEILSIKTVSVDGSAVNNLTISGGFTSRIFQVPSGITLTLSDLDLKNGFAVSNGGAFYNLGQVKLSEVTFENNFDGNNITPFTGDGEILIESGEVLIKD